MHMGPPKNEEQTFFYKNKINVIFLKVVSDVGLIFFNIYKLYQDFF